MNKLVAGLLLGLMLVSTGCSTQYRTAEPQLSSEELDQLMADFAGRGGASEINALVNGSGSGARVFHATSTSASPASSVLSVGDMGFFIRDFSGYNSRNVGLEQVDVVLVDNFTDSGRVFTVMLKLFFYDSNDTVFFVASTQPDDFTFTDDDLTFYIQADNGEEIMVRTRDVSDIEAEELGSAVKLELYVDGGESYLGHISTMAGYEY